MWKSHLSHCCDCCVSEKFQMFFLNIPRPLSLLTNFRQISGLNYHCQHVQNCCTESKLQLTLAIIKPHICKHPIMLEEIRNIILQNNFLCIASTLVHMNQTQAQLFYEEHQGKFFYDRLVSLMTSGESWVHILARENAIKKWREILGPTKVYKTRLDHPDTIRGMFGFTDTRNACHGSDSETTARKEIAFFFPNFPYDKWLEEQEPIWRRILLNKDIENDGTEKIWFNEKKLCHEIIVV